MIKYGYLPIGLGQHDGLFADRIPLCLIMGRIVNDKQHRAAIRVLKQRDTAVLRCTDSSRCGKLAHQRNARAAKQRTDRAACILAVRIEIGSSDSGGRDIVKQCAVTAVQHRCAVCGHEDLGIKCVVTCRLAERIDGLMFSVGINAAEVNLTRCISDTEQVLQTVNTADCDQRYARFIQGLNLCVKK